MKNGDRKIKAIYHPTNPEQVYACIGDMCSGKVYVMPKRGGPMGSGRYASAAHRIIGNSRKSYPIMMGGGVRTRFKRSETDDTINLNFPRPENEDPFGVVMAGYSEMIVDGSFSVAETVRGRNKDFRRFHVYRESNRFELEPLRAGAEPLWWNLRKLENSFVHSVDRLVIVRLAINDDSFIPNSPVRYEGIDPTPVVDNIANGTIILDMQLRGMSVDGTNKIAITDNHGFKIKAYIKRLIPFYVVRNEPIPVHIDDGMMCPIPVNLELEDDPESDDDNDRDDDLDSDDDVLDVAPTPAGPATRYTRINDLIRASEATS